MMHDAGPPLLLAALILGGALALRWAILAEVRRVRRLRRLELEAAYVRYDRALTGRMDESPAP